MSGKHLTTLLVERTDGDSGCRSSSSSSPGTVHRHPAPNIQSLDCRSKRHSRLFSCAGGNRPKWSNEERWMVLV